MRPSRFGGYGRNLEFSPHFCLHSLRVLPCFLAVVFVVTCSKYSKFIFTFLALLRTPFLHKCIFSFVLDVQCCLTALADTQ